MISKAHHLSCTLVCLISLLLCCQIFAGSNDNDTTTDVPRRKPISYYRLGIHTTAIHHQLAQTPRFLSPIPSEMSFPDFFSFSVGLVFDIPIAPFRIVFSPHYTAYSTLSTTTESKPDGLFIDYNLFIDYRVFYYPLSVRIPVHYNRFDFFLGAGLNYTHYTQADAIFRFSDVYAGYGYMVVFSDTRRYTDRKALKRGYLLEGGMSCRIIDDFIAQLTFISVYNDTPVDVKMYYPIFHSRQSLLRFSISYML